MLKAALYDLVLAGAERRGLHRWRRELLAGVAGDVVEIGAGTGANLAVYGPGVRRLVLVEPDPAMLERLARRAAGKATVVAGSAARLPLADDSVDAVVSTLVLCSVDRVDAALAEILRVLRPGGQLHLIEHVAAPAGSSLRRAQHLIAPVWSRCAGGCSVELPTREVLAAAGFDVSGLVDDVLGVPVPLVRPVLRGVTGPTERT